MRQRVSTISVGLAVACLGPFAAIASAGTRVYSSPRSGPPSTHFTLRFRAPEATGRIGAVRRTDHLYISGPRGAGCISTVRLRIIPVGRGAHVKIVLRPARTTRWCVGRFHGRIVRTESLICSRSCAGSSLPGPLTIARFSFGVTRPVTPRRGAPA